MQKKILVTLTATATAFSMLVAPCVTALAEDAAGEGSSQVQESAEAPTSTETPPSTPEVADSATETQAAAAQDVTTPVIVTPESSEKEVVVESVTVDKGQTAVSVSTPDGSVTVNEDVTSSGYSGTSTTHYTDGDKTYNISNPAVEVSAGDVTVKGNVNANGDSQTGIRASSSDLEINVNVDKNVVANSYGIETRGANTTVTVNGSVNSGKDAIDAQNGATVIVNGNSISTGAAGQISSGEYNKETKQYEKETESYYGSGIHTDGSANIFVKGDVSGVHTASVGIYQSKQDHDNKEEQGKIIITGTISNSDDNAARINISYSTTRDNDGNMLKATYADTADLLASIPEMTIYAMDKGQISVGRTVEDKTVTSFDVYKEVVKTINYIIKQDAESQTNYGLKLSDDNENVKKVSGLQGETYDTVNINEAFKVAANVPEGYEVTAGENVKVTNNGNGTFTLVLTSVKGGINVKVTAIVRPTESAGSSESFEVEVQDVTPTYADPNKAPAGAIVVSNNIGAADAPSTVAAISGTKPARTVAYKISSITPIQYKESIISNVAAAPQGGAMNIETDRVACFDTKMLQAIAARPDIDVNVVFTYGGKKLKVTIPAGYDVMSLLDDYGYCGFLRLMSILGSTEL